MKRKTGAIVFFKPKGSNGELSHHLKDLEFGDEISIGEMHRQIAQQARQYCLGNQCDFVRYHLCHQEGG